MIIGLGTDIINIDRISSILVRFGKKFERRILTEEEQVLAYDRADLAQTLASRWAAKEACSKALGTGLRMGIHWRQISIENNSLGAPVINLSGAALQRLEAITPTGHYSLVHVSLSEDRPWAFATVIIDSIVRVGSTSVSG